MPEYAFHMLFFDSFHNKIMLNSYDSIKLLDLPVAFPVPFLSLFLHIPKRTMLEYNRVLLVYAPGIMPSFLRAMELLFPIHSFPYDKMRFPDKSEVHPHLQVPIHLLHFFLYQSLAENFLLLRLIHHQIPYQGMHLHIFLHRLRDLNGHSYSRLNNNNPHMLLSPTLWLKLDLPRGKIQFPYI